MTDKRKKSTTGDKVRANSMKGSEGKPKKSLKKIYRNNDCNRLDGHA